MNRIVMFAGLCVAVCAAGCHSGDEGHTDEEKFIVTSPVRMDTTFIKEYVAQIRSVRDIEIRAQEKGYLDAIYVDEGQFVKAGQLLFRIMPKVYEAELHKAEAEARAAEIELQNTKALADKNVVSKNELALAQAGYDKAKAEAELARVHLSFTAITAPFDGIIDRLPKKIGSLIDEGELLTMLSDNSEMFVYFNVSEPEYLDYQAGAKDSSRKDVNLLLANNKPLPYKGAVETIESEFNNETGSIAFRARFPNPDKLLRNGETGKVLMTEPLKQALLIPQKATYEIQDKIYVFVIDANNVVHSRNISVRGSLPDLYVVDSGLEVDDHILLEGLQKVKEDDHIRFAFEQPADVMKHLRLKAE